MSEWDEREVLEVLWGLTISFLIQKLKKDVRMCGTADCPREEFSFADQCTWPNFMSSLNLMLIVGLLQTLRSPKGWILISSVSLILLQLDHSTNTTVYKLYPLKTNMEFPA